MQPTGKARNTDARRKRKLRDARNALDTRNGHTQVARETIAAASFSIATLKITAESILNAYAQGAFPMADDRGVIHWYTADPRGVMPLDGFKPPRSLRQLWKRRKFEVRINHGFRAVMTACRERRLDHTWISAELIELYCELHHLGFAHSVEAWHDGKLAGGLYGVAMGAAFFGESMFHYETDASKIALFALVERLREREFELLDTQAVTQHLKRFGATEIGSDDYIQKLHDAIPKTRVFD